MASSRITSLLGYLIGTMSLKRIVVTDTTATTKAAVATTDAANDEYSKSL